METTMTTYHKRAIELANDILKSEYGKDFVDAEAELAPDDAEFLRIRAEFFGLANSVVETLRGTLGLDAPKKGCASGCAGGGGCCKK